MLDVLWAATSVAVVGASARAGAPGHSVMIYLRRFGYAGRVVPINPTATVIDDRKAYPSVSAYCQNTGERIDLALILVPSAAVADAVADCARSGVPVAIVGSSGFAETGPAGRELQDQLVRTARAYGMRLVGPNCIGSLGPESGLVASFSPMFGGAETELVGSHDAVPRDAGGIGFASASGALGFGTVSLALARGLPLRAAVSTGNEADVSALEVLAAMAADPGCTALLGYAESVADSAGLRALASAAATHHKPVALLVGGVSDAGAQAAASHTGALATGARVVAGVLRQFGIVQVDDVDDLLDAGDTFALLGGRSDGGPDQGRAAGDRVAVITTSGGSGILATDAIERAGLRLARLDPATTAKLAQIVPAYGSVANPVDVTATVMNDRTLVARALGAVAGDDGVDVLVVCFCVLVGDDVDAIVTALADAKQRYGKPVLVARTGADHLAPQAAARLRSAGIPSYPTPGRAVRAAAAWLGSHPRPPQAPGPRAGHDSGPVAGADEAVVKTALAAAGIRVPYGQVVTDATAAARECPDRAVFKVVAPGLVHKSDRGGVLCNVDPAGAADAYRQLMAVPGATGVLIEEQVPPGVELLVGIAGSALGRLLTIGIGGVLTEVIDDVAIRLLPVTGDDVRAMLAETRAAAMLAGVRGALPANVDAFVRLVLDVAEVAEAWPGDLDLNPVVVTPDEAVVLDAALVPVGATVTSGRQIEEA